MLVYPAIVVQYCVIVQSFWPVIVFLPDKVSVVVVLKDKFTPKKKRREFSRYLLTPPRADGKVRWVFGDQRHVSAAAEQNRVEAFSSTAGADVGL